jgi:group I intron endonuclease
MQLGRVYMIVSPSNKKYVGSTTRTFEKRWEDYKILNCKSQKRLYNSLIKYGVNNHKFYEVWTGDVQLMLKYEAIVGRLWNVLDRHCGLNSQLPKESDIYSCISKETRINMSISAKQKAPRTEETKLKIIESIKKSFTKERKENIRKRMKGHITSEETRQKISNARKGKKLSKEQCENISKGKRGIASPNKGIKYSDETKLKMSLAKKGVKQSNSHRENLNKAIQKKIIQTDLEDNFIKEWDSLISAAKELSLSSGSICDCCKGKLKRVSKYKFKYKQIIKQ